jgi:hypothetical protein
MRPLSPFLHLMGRGLGEGRRLVLSFLQPLTLTLSP